MGPYVYRPQRVEAERRWGRARLVAVAVGVLWVGTLFDGGVPPVSADSVAGRGTSGACIGSGTAVTLWQQSITGLAAISIKYRLTLRGSGDQPTVAWARWQSTTGGNTGPMAIFQQGQVTGDNNDAVFWVDGTWTGTSITFVAGSAGTWAYVAQVQGYGATACMVISDVVVTRHERSGPQVTPPPGGGGIAPTPTPASEPTMPAVPTAIPDGEPGDGNVCWLNREGESVCYPKPPSGWCYNDGGFDTILEPCASTTAPPTEPPDTSCAVHWWCIDVTQSTAGNPILGAEFPELLLTENTSYNVFASHKGISGAGGSYTELLYFYTAADAIIQCAAFGSGLPPVSNFEFTAVSDAFYREYSATVTYHAADQSSGCAGLSSGDGAVYAWMTTAGGYAGQTSRFFYWIDPADWVAPTGSPPPSEPPSTMPPNWCGATGATCPPFNGGGGVDVEVDVDICEDDPDILACQYSIDICAADPGIAACATAPATIPTFGSPGPASTWLEARLGDLGSGLSAKAPFGYIDQVGDELTGAIENAAGEDLDLSFTMPWFAPEEAGGVRDLEVEIPLADYSADLAGWRWFFLALLMLAAARFFIGLALRAVGSGKVRDEE